MKWVAKVVLTLAFCLWFPVVFVVLSLWMLSGACAEAVFEFWDWVFKKLEG